MELLSTVLFWACFALNLIAMLYHVVRADMLRKQAKRVDEHLESLMALTAEIRQVAWKHGLLAEVEKEVTEKVRRANEELSRRV